MSKLQYLRDQAAKAERLAGAMTDTLTVERLMAFAAECRSQINEIGNGSQRKELQISAL